MYEYSFFFAPEGRKVATIIASSLADAKRAFYRQNPQFKVARGEIYINVICYPKVLP